MRIAKSFPGSSPAQNPVQAKLIRNGYATQTHTICAFNNANLHTNTQTGTIDVIHNVISKCISYRKQLAKGSRYDQINK